MANKSLEDIQKLHKRFTKSIDALKEMDLPAVKGIDSALAQKKRTLQRLETKRKDLLAVKAESDARYKAMFETIDSDIGKVKKDMEAYQDRAIFPPRPVFMTYHIAVGAGRLIIRDHIFIVNHDAVGSKIYKSIVRISINAYVSGAYVPPPIQLMPEGSGEFEKVDIITG